MAQVSFLLSEPRFTGAARQVSLLAPALARAGWTTGIHVPARHLRNWAGLRRLPGVVHAFGLKALGWWSLATTGTRRPKVVLSLSGRERFTWFDRRCLRGVSRVVVPHAAAAAALFEQGVSADRLVVVPPAVGDPPPSPDRAEFCHALGIPPDAPLLLSAGRMDTRGPMFGSVWAFEFLRYTDDAVRLLLVGDGPARDRVEAGARGLAPDGSRVVFLGARPDVPALVGLADLVAVPQPAGGANVALEAMAAGRAVVGGATPDLAALTRDGQTGLLTRPNCPPELAAGLRQLLLDPARRQALGQAARAHVRARHAVDTVVQAMEAVYRD
jgi:glycosyltransferase involved in cell wall biosynthesis